MKRIVIFGASRLATIVRDVIERDIHGTVAGYVINDAFYSEETHRKDGIIPFSEMAEHYPPDKYQCVFGFMVSDMYKSREETYLRVKALGYEFPNIIHPEATVETEDIGEGNLILPGVVIERHCKIGSMNIFWQNATLPHDNTVGDFNNIAPSASFSGYSEIGNHCFIGNNSVINNCVKVHDYAFVGATAFVAKDLPSYSVLVPPRCSVLEGKISTDMGF